MKRIGNLMPQICDRANVSAAVHRAARGKCDRAEVRQFLQKADTEIDRIVAELHAGDIQFGPYRSFQVRDTKRREIHAPPFRDRVVHHALFAVAGPVLETGAIEHSYACRVGRGQHACVAQARCWVRRQDWFLKVDIAKYYDSIEHRRLMTRLERRFSESRLLTLFESLLSSYEVSPGSGLPIGALSSQYFANFFLDETDHFVKQSLRVNRYLRYMDDLLMIGAGSELPTLADRLAEHLGHRGLSIKQGGVINRCRIGIPWLGLVIYPDRSRLGKKARKRLRANYRELERHASEGRIDDRQRQQVATSMFAFAEQGDETRWRQSLCRRYTFGETPEPATRDPWWLLEPHREEVSLRVSQPEEARQPQQEPGLPPRAGSRSGEAGTGWCQSPKDASSRAPLVGDETTGKPGLLPEIPSCGTATKKGGGPALPARREVE